MVLALVIGSAAVLVVAAAGWILLRSVRGVPAAERAGRRAERMRRADLLRRDASRRAETVHPDFIRDWMR